ncbi:ATP-binding cassette domain-containing protein [Candidatus Poriferisocius sp.]|uniref:branched-chain amino acid ABC transporter ATP-binding protein/permease n=1 Tax=Candidatus Poriferisocius sp. TaxID=3101276 RepID=UPI003B0123F9
MAEQRGPNAAHAGMFPNLRRDVAFPIVGVGLLFGVFVAVGLLYQSSFGGAGERLVTTAMINAIIVLGIQIYVGNTGVLSFGHIGFGAIAGYTFAIFAIAPAEKVKRIPDAPLGLTDVDMGSWGAVGVAIAVTVVVAIFVGIGLARSGAESGAVAATVITLALLFVTHEVARHWPELTGGERAGLSFRIGGKLDTRVPIYLALAGSLVLARLFAQSRRGRLAKAGREDDLAARAMGVNPMVQQMIALLTSVAVVSVGASLKVYETGSLLPEDFFFFFTLLTLTMLIVGGRNSVTGALFGVAVITVGRELARRMGQDGFEVFGLGLDSEPLDWIFRENLQTVFLGVAMLGFMIWRPKGLLSDWEFDDWLYRRFTRTQSAPPVPQATMSDESEARLEVSDVSVVFGGFQALSQSGFEVSSGEVVGIIGPNGAGKTTMLNVITGLVPATSGQVRLNGTDLIGTPSHEVARAGLVRTFQNLRLFGSLTVRENVEVTRLVAIAEHDDRSAPETDVLVAAAGLWDHRDRRASELDYGNSRRLELARAAAARPLFLLLDEPTSGMSDTESLAMVEQVQTMAALVSAGVVVIDHDLDFIIGICDRIYCLDRGSVIASGTPEEIQADPSVQAAYLGSSAT